ncbi:MAG: hypothetical protein Q7O66_14020 [Dehalococcoidia bacterium]|nr:hypothetical protein [Dehalococcoidia bacterium]
MNRALIAYLMSVLAVVDGLGILYLHAHKDDIVGWKELGLGLAWLYVVIGTIAVPVWQKANFREFLGFFTNIEKVQRSAEGIATDVWKVYLLEEKLQRQGIAMERAARAHKAGQTDRLKRASAVAKLFDYYVDARAQDYPRAKIEAEEQLREA